MNNFKKLTILSLTSLFIVNVMRGYVPTTSISGTRYNIGLPYGITLKHTDIKLPYGASIENDEFKAPSIKLPFGISVKNQGVKLPYGIGLESDETQNKTFTFLSNAFYLYQQNRNDRAEIAGVMLSARYNLLKILNGLSMSIHAPFMVTRRNQNQSEKLYGFSVNDVDTALSYDFLNNKGQEGTINAGITIPTSKMLTLNKNTPLGLGNGGHIVLFTTLDMKNCVIGNDEHALSLVSGLGYRYLISSTKKLNLGLAHFNDFTDAFELVSNEEVEQTKEKVDNILTQSVKLSPGFQIEGRLGILCESFGFFAGAGALAYYQQGTSASLSKNNLGLLSSLSKIDTEKNPSDISTEKDIVIPLTKIGDKLALRGYADVGYEFRAGSVPGFISVGVEFPLHTRINNLKDKSGKYFESFDANLKAGLSF